MNITTLALVGTICLVTVFYVVFRKQRKVAVNEVRRLSSHFRATGGCSTVYNDYQRIRKKVIYYGILPEEFGFDDFKSLHSAAISALRLYIDQTRERIAELEEEAKRLKNTSTENQGGDFEESLDVLETALAVSKADIIDLRLEMEEMLEQFPNQSRQIHSLT
jgi:hypothetical protein